MKRFGKQIIAAILAGILAVIPCMGIPAFAAESDSVVDDDSKNDSPGGSISSAIITVEPFALISEKDPSYPFTGKEIRPPVSLTMGGIALEAGEDYKVSYSNNVLVGTGTIHVTGTGTYSGSKTANFTITKGEQSLAVSARTTVIKARRLIQVIKPGSVFLIRGAVGKVTFTKGGGPKNVVISKEGRIIVTNAAKGTYKLLVYVTASGNRNYNAATVAADVLIRVV